MNLKHGKKYEAADGVVYRVRDMNDGLFDESDDTQFLWRSDGSGVGNPALIRRHYKKPQPAHKLDLKPGDVVKLVVWEDGIGGGKKREYKCDKDGPYSGTYEFKQPKGHRPLFRVVSRS
jgi:hypothetical protein